MKNKKYIINYNIIIIPGMLFLLIFNIIPMFGIIMAFQNYKVGKGILNSPWVGLDNIIFMFQMPDGIQVMLNTFIIAVLKIVGGLIIPIFFALILNEVKVKWFKRTVQTIIYLPHFLSWVILAGIFMSMLSVDGIFNKFLGIFGTEPIMFLSKSNLFRPIIVTSHIWKEFGFGTIIYLAALTNIDPTLYEAAEIDGATRLQQLWNITLPGISTTIVLMMTLSLGSILNAGFEQIFNMYNPLVYSTGDIIDTYVYRVGLIQMQYSLGTAIGLLKSVISMVLIILSYKLAAKYANYRIF